MKYVRAEVKRMDAGLIIVIILGGLIIVGGPIISHYAAKASAKAEKAEKAEKAQNGIADKK